MYIEDIQVSNLVYLRLAHYIEEIRFRFSSSMFSMEFQT